MPGCQWRGNGGFQRAIAPQQDGVRNILKIHEKIDGGGGSNSLELEGVTKESHVCPHFYSPGHAPAGCCMHSGPKLALNS